MECGVGDIATVWDGEMAGMLDPATCRKWSTRLRSGEGGGKARVGTWAYSGTRLPM